MGWVDVFVCKRMSKTTLRPSRPQLGTASGVITQSLPVCIEWRATEVKTCVDFLVSLSLSERVVGAVCDDFHE
ncbi:unnamed protein product [Vitrella brassicaformis CCMP3155]|uniref:Uncharacterized protein n=1 Tax=Vitrella brassicaformis (strain CCMP3155) TaxID=1169540 RepID=A0A0G4FCK5_VITBC|nr:unnamed protein product [Vitrella brassicaformis CCMP3155]|eukprot:CEM10283.1 unnamed protein product [Vitrella brassicaformis CCMP3155]